MINSGHLAALNDFIKQRIAIGFNEIVPLSSHTTIEETVDEVFDKEPLIQNLSVEEKIILYISLVPHFYPEFYSNIIHDFLPQGGEFPEFGGVRGTNHRGILPTGETVQFLLAGKDIAKRLVIQELFDEQNAFFQHDILWLEQVKEGEPFMSGRIIVSQEWEEKILKGKELKPRFSYDFPAKLTTTRMKWDDVVLHPYTHEQIDDIKRWIKFHEVLYADENLSRKINKGYRVLFYGPPGTGKTLTATLLGKEFGKDVYRVDLSQIVSKYIGETEKNLSRIFDRAEHKDWILFFDEADALFGKRTNVQSSHDKFANQEVSYLLQRIEEFSGLLILASNYKSNIDEAFLRRFHSVVHFPMPNAQERHRLWKKALPVSVNSNGGLELEKLAEQFELSGASIVNIMQFATLKALSKENKELAHDDLVEGIRKEMRKEEKSF
jgi:DNA polymerase III delta prime subunit